MTNNKPLRAIIWCAVSTQAQAAEDRISLELQENEAREFCERQGYEIIDVLKVDGHTRSDPDLDRLIQFHLKQGNRAYFDLREAWRNQSFDVFIAYDDTRISRGAYEQIVKSIIYSGASIYRIHGGWITERDVEMQAALGGIKANAGMREFQEKRKVGMGKRVQRGLNNSYAPCMSHRTEYDPKTRKAVRLVLDESKQVLWQHVYELLMERVAWSKMEMELYARWGHVNPNTGRRFSKSTIQQVVYNPQFWGHTGRYYDGVDVGQAWVHEDDIAPPEGVELYRHTIPAVWTGEQALAAREELKRREAFSTNSRPNQRHAFASLLVCGECGYTLSCRSSTAYVKSLGSVKQYARWLCAGKTSGALYYGGCNRKSISHAEVKEYIDLLLRQVIAAGDLASLTPPSRQADELHDLKTRLERLRQDYGDTIELQRMARTLPEKMRHQEALDSLIEQIGILEKAQQRFLPDNHESALSALRDLQAITVNGEMDRFWSLEPGQQNQLLHTLFGSVRLVVVNGEIVGLAHHQRKPNARGRLRSP